MKSYNNVHIQEVATGYTVTIQPDTTDGVEIVKTFDRDKDSDPTDQFAFVDTTTLEQIYVSAKLIEFDQLTNYIANMMGIIDEETEIEIKIHKKVV